MLTLEQELDLAARLCQDHGFYRAAARLALKAKPRKKTKRVAVFVGGKARPENAFKIDASKIKGDGK